jgi:hypothetical protein
MKKNILNEKEHKRKRIFSILFGDRIAGIVSRRMNVPHPLLPPSVRNRQPHAPTREYSIPSSLFSISFTAFGSIPVNRTHHPMNTRYRRPFFSSTAYCMLSTLYFFLFVPIRVIRG